MDRSTIEIYEERGAQWAASRRPVRQADARAFGASVAAAVARLDLGCGAGRYLGDVGVPAIGLDASWTMLDACRRNVIGAVLVQGDLELLPFAARSLGGGWANMSYLHIPRRRLPMALAELHQVLQLGSPIDLQVLIGDYEGNALPDDDVGGRFFASWQPGPLGDVLEGAGFAVAGMEFVDDVVRVKAERVLTLADTVGPGMRLLVVGLNPSVYSAQAGIGYFRPGNRFWPAALASGLVSKDRDPFHALRVDGVGMTDIVKRSTAKAAELGPQEYRSGMDRVHRLVRWLEPRAVCFVGLTGWRVAVDRDAVAGVQRHGFAGRPVYVMPSTSGANAHARPAELTEHFAAALAVAASS
jgi:double-stranded uracil-DNA glycosylase